MKKIVALIYKYYLNRNLPMPYLRALLTFLIIILVHIYLIFTVFNVFAILPNWYINNVEISGNINILFFAVILFIIFLLKIKKINLNKYTFSESQIDSGWKNLIIYNCCVFFTLLIIIYL